jgi:hypothetical protein
LHRMTRAVLSLLAAFGAASLLAQGPAPPYRPLRWVSLDLDSLTPVERQAVLASPFLAPSNWGVEIAAETLGTTPFIFVRSRVGSGAGYGYIAAYAYVPNAGPLSGLP